MKHLNNNKIQTICVKEGAANLGTEAVRIEMKEGTGWITYSKEDLVLNAGDTIELEASNYPIVVSSLYANQPIIFDIIYEHDRMNEPSITGSEKTAAKSRWGLKSLVTSATHLLQ